MASRRFLRSELKTLEHEYAVLESLQRGMVAALKTRDVKKLREVGLHLAIAGGNVLGVTSESDRRQTVRAWRQG
jgi:hypothetical protein